MDGESRSESAQMSPTATTESSVKPKRIYKPRKPKDPNAPPPKPRAGKGKKGASTPTESAAPQTPVATTTIAFPSILLPGMMSTDAPVAALQASSSSKRKEEQEEAIGDLDIIPGKVKQPGEGAPEEGEEDDMDEEGGGERREDSFIEPKTLAEREGLRILLDSFTPEQQARYEAYRRAHLPKPTMKRFLYSLTDWSVFPASGVIIMAGAGKIFVGEMVEEAISVQRKWNDPPGPLRPEHLREAFRLYRKRTTTIESPLFHRRLF